MWPPRRATTQGCPCSPYRARAAPRIPPALDAAQRCPGSQHNHSAIPTTVSHMSSHVARPSWPWSGVSNPRAAPQLDAIAAGTALRGRPQKQLPSAASRRDHGWGSGRDARPGVQDARPPRAACAPCKAYHTFALKSGVPSRICPPGDVTTARASLPRTGQAGPSSSCTWGRLTRGLRPGRGRWAFPC